MKCMLIILVTFLFSCASQRSNITTAIYHVDSSNVLMLHMLDGDVIQIDLEDEVDNYYFNTDGVEYKLEYVSGGYSYGKHLGGDYVYINGLVIPVIED